MDRLVRLRAAADEDATAIVRLCDAREPGAPPLTVERYREERTEQSARGEQEEYVAAVEGRVAGHASLRWAWWTSDPAVYEVTVRVAPSDARRGIGSALYQLLGERLAVRGARRLVAWVRADAGGRAFAARHGCRETGQVLEEYRLDIAAADTSGCEGLGSSLVREGLRVAALDELPWQDEELQRALQYVWADSGDDPPDADELRASFGTWQQQVLHGSGLSPDTHWVALDGGRPVGMTFLKRLSAGDYENDYTGVASSHRRRGIATVLKLRAIRWAQQNGATTFWTSSEVGNAAMIGLNRRLGYVPGVRRVEVACEVAQTA